jgi:hypothetical protein
MDVELGAAVAPDPQPAPSGWLSSFVSGILSYMTGHDLQPEVDYATYKHQRRAAHAQPPPLTCRRQRRHGFCMKISNFYC